VRQDIGLHDDAGETINEQVTTGDVFRHLPVVVRLTEAIVDHHGPLAGRLWAKKRT